MNELLILAAIVVAIGGGYSLVRMIGSIFWLAFALIVGLINIIIAIGGNHGERRRNPDRDGRARN